MKTRLDPHPCVWRLSLRRMLSLQPQFTQAAVSIWLEWTPPPCPECSWLDNWFSGSKRDALEGQEECIHFLWPDATRHADTTQSAKEKFPLSLGHTHTNTMIIALVMTKVRHSPAWMDANTSHPHILLHQLCSIFINLSRTGHAEPGKCFGT